MQKGKIVLSRFPFTDLSSSKRRHTLVLINTPSSEEDTIVAFISSVIPETLSQSDLILQTDDLKFSSTGLSKTSVLKLDKIATLNKSIFSGELGEFTISIRFCGSKAEIGFTNLDQRFARYFHSKS